MAALPCRLAVAILVSLLAGSWPAARADAAPLAARAAPAQLAAATCPPGTTKDPDGACVPTGAPPSSVAPSCPPGTARDPNGRCVAPPAPKPPSGRCPPGTLRMPGGVCLPIAIVFPPPSSQPETLQMPRLISSQLSEAQVVLQKMRLRKPETRHVPSERPRDMVVGQDPDPGQAVTGRTPITLTLSDGALVVVPEVTRRTLREAASLLSARDLRLGAEATEASSGPTGVLLRTDPRAGTVVKRRSAVDYVLSVAPPLSMPKVIGSPIGDARTALARLGLQDPQVLAARAEARKDTVIDQAPGAGDPVTPGTPIRLTVSEGPPRVAVPPLAGLTPQEAAGALGAGGLRLGNQSAQAADREGRIIASTPPEGALVAPGSVVDVVVATPLPAVVPSVIGLSERDAIERLSQAGFLHERSPGREGHEQMDQVAQQVPRGGARATRGATVTLTMAERLSSVRPSASDTSQWPTRRSERMVAVPNVIGDRQGDAEQALRRAGFRVQTSPAGWSSVRKDTVSDQSPAGGYAPFGSVVVLTLGETIGPLLGGAAVLLLGGAALAWTTSWPLRLRVRGALEGDIRREVLDLQPAGAAVLARWSLEQPAPAASSTEGGPAAIDPDLDMRLDWSVDIAGFEGVAMPATGEPRTREGATP